MQMHMGTVMCTAHADACGQSRSPRSTPTLTLFHSPSYRYRPLTPYRVRASRFLFSPAKFRAVPLHVTEAPRAPTNWYGKGTLTKSRGLYYGLYCRYQRTLAAHAHAQPIFISCNLINSLKSTRLHLLLMYRSSRCRVHPPPLRPPR